MPEAVFTFHLVASYTTIVRCENPYLCFIPRLPTTHRNKLTINTFADTRGLVVGEVFCVLKEGLGGVEGEPYMVVWMRPFKGCDVR